MGKTRIRCHWVALLIRLAEQIACFDEMCCVAKAMVTLRRIFPTRYLILRISVSKANTMSFDQSLLQCGIVTIAFFLDMYCLLELVLTSVKLNGIGTIIMLQQTQGFLHLLQADANKPPSTIITLIQIVVVLGQLLQKIALDRKHNMSVR